MQIVYCWRCRRELPMLDDDEWAVIGNAHVASATNPRRALAILNREARRRGLQPVAPPAPDAEFIDQRLYHLTAGYALFTGAQESSPTAVWHHVASRYGPPCEHCGKPLRTPQARWCPACGGWRTGEPEPPRPPTRRRGGSPAWRRIGARLRDLFGLPARRAG